jgi:hypothetical protein
VSDVVLVAVIAAFPGVVTAIGTLWLTWRNFRLTKATYGLVNGQSVALRRLNRVAALKTGEMRGREWQRRRGDQPEGGPAGPQGPKLRN